MKKKDETTDLLAPAAPAPMAVQPTAALDIPINRVIQLAIEKGSDPGDIEKLIALHERMSASAARAAFHRAMAEFKAICPAIPRRTPNPQFSVTIDGVKRPRMFASLEDIERTIRDPLGRCGLSFRWGDVTITGTTMVLSCIVSHAAGHSESSAVTMPVESSAGCSAQQKYGIAGTYAQRYSLIQALGLTTCDEDSDGNEPDAADQPKITDHQAANIETALAGMNADVGAFCTFMGVERIADIPATRFAYAIAAIEKKRKKNTGGA